MATWSIYGLHGRLPARHGQLTCHVGCHRPHTCPADSAVSTRGPPRRPLALRFIVPIPATRRWQGCVRCNPAPARVLSCPADAQ
eukprot:scaffold4251_cov430-Prasinococcus_capsulatus_cf.AAC.8